MKRNSLIIKKTVSIMVLLSLFVVQIGCALFNKTARLESMINAEKYNEALDFYRENRDDIDKGDAVNVFESALDKMYKNYLNGKTDRRDIQEYINDLEKVQSDALDSYGEGILNDVNKVELSREAFLKAENAFKNSSYIEAISYYEQVIKDDTNYNDAQKQISECRESYKKQKISEAEKYAQKEDYLNAIKLLKDAVAIAGESDEINSLMNTYQTKFDDYIFNTAASLEKEAKYDEAIKLLSDNKSFVSDSKKCEKLISDYKDIAVQELLSKSNVSDLITAGKYEEASKAIETIKYKYPDSSLLLKTMEDFEKKYVEYELPIIEAFIGKSDYESAYAECENALIVLPDNSEFISKRDSVKAKLPHSLMNNFVSSQEDNGFVYLIGDGKYDDHTKDLFGNEYTKAGEGFYFRGIDYGDEHTGYAEFRLDKKYKTLKGAALVCEKKLESSIKKVELVIYGDDKVIYRKAITNRSTPEDLFNVDVSSVNWLKVEIKITGRCMINYYAGVFNPKLYYK